MSLIKRLFHNPQPTRRPQPMGRACRRMSIAERLDLSLRTGAFDARVFAWGY